MTCASGGVVLFREASFEMIRVSMSKNSFSGLIADGPETRVNLTNCSLMSNIGSGARVTGGASAAFVDTDVFDNTSDGVHVHAMGETRFRGCDVHHNNESGIRVSDFRSRARISGSSIRSNGHANLTCLGSGKLDVSCSRIAEGHQEGVKVSAGGIATLRDCRIVRATKSGVIVKSVDSKVKIFNCVVKEPGQVREEYFCLNW